MTGHLKHIFFSYFFFLWGGIVWLELFKTCVPLICNYIHSMLGLGWKYVSTNTHQFMITGHLEGLDSEKEEDPPRLLRFLIFYLWAFFAALFLQCPAIFVRLLLFYLFSFRRFTEKLLHIILIDSMHWLQWFIWPKITPNHISQIWKKRRGHTSHQQWGDVHWFKHSAIWFWKQNTFFLTVLKSYCELLTVLKLF